MTKATLEIKIIAKCEIFFKDYSDEDLERIAQVKLSLAEKLLKAEDFEATADVHGVFL